LGNFNKYILTFIAVIFTFSLFAQRADPADAKEHFKFGNFIDALKVYRKLMEKDPKNAEYPYKSGLCILFTEINRTEAVKFLELAVERNADPDALFYLGRAYHFNMQLDEALGAYNKYISQGSGTKIKEVDREMQMVKNAKKLLQSPIDISFENAGDKINSEYPDYYPFVTPNESFIVFTSRRKSGVREFDGYYPSAIYYSPVINRNFVAVKKGNAMINSTYDD